MSDSQADRRSQKQKQTIPLRPLLGIHRDVSSTMVPAGAFTDVNGALPSDTGLIRRYGFRTVEVEFPEIVRWDYIGSFIDDNGVKITFGIGDGKFYELAGNGFTHRPNVYPNANTSDPGGTATVTVTAGSQLIEGTGTLWQDEGGFARGDKIYVDGGAESFTVDTVIDNDTIKIIEIPTTTYTDVSYYVERLMTPAADWVIQVVRLDRLLYIVTGKNTVMMYNIDDPDFIYTWWEMSIALGVITDAPDNPNFIPKCISAFKDRIWTGNIFSDADSRWYTSRISWTPILSPTIFEPETQFNDLISVGGEISCLHPLGNYLMVYFEFGVQFGRETAIPGDTFPLAFDFVETSRRGVLQPDAVCSAVGGNFFVSTDNVYYIGQDLKNVPIAEEPKELMFRSALIKTRYKIQNFFEAEGLAVAASTSEGAYEEIWAFNFSTKEWTRFDVNADYVTVFALGSRLTYGDYEDGQIYSGPTDDYGGPCNNQIWDTTRSLTDPNYFTNYEVSPYTGDDMSNGLAKNDPDGPDLTINTTMVPIYGIYDSASGIDESRLTLLTDFTDCGEIYGGSSVVSASDRFYITTGRFIHVFDAEQSLDYDGTPIPIMMETGDLDLGVPDTYKTFIKWALRLDEEAPAELAFLIETSDDSGITWYRMGTLYVYEGGKEGRCNFLHTGSATRFRLTSETESLSYTIVEMTMDVKLRGTQFGDF